ncbi:MAG: SdrD B-like domain-containing protein, partial [Herbiconiux sp.]|nr:SdrD B-like domain-containing protein [Herbiconiux sp.]
MLRMEDELLSCHRVRERTTRQGLVGLLVLMLLSPLMLLLAAGPSNAATSCLPQVDQTGCIAGTVGSRSDPIEGADVQLLAEDGTVVETVTTEADGKFAFTVQQAGTFFVKLDPESLPDGFEQTPPGAAFEGPDGSLKVTARLGGTVVPALTVRSADFDAGGTGKFDQLVQSTASGIRLGLLLALASVGLSLIYGTTG